MDTGATPNANNTHALVTSQLLHAVFVLLRTSIHLRFAKEGSGQGRRKGGKEGERQGENQLYTRDSFNLSSYRPDTLFSAVVLSLVSVTCVRVYHAHRSCPCTALVPEFWVLVFVHTASCSAPLTIVLLATVRLPHFASVTWKNASPGL